MSRFNSYEEEVYWQQELVRARGLSERVQKQIDTTPKEKRARLMKRFLNLKSKEFAIKREMNKGKGQIENPVNSLFIDPFRSSLLH